MIVPNRFYKKSQTHQIQHQSTSHSLIDINIVTKSSSYFVNKHSYLFPNISGVSKCVGGKKKKKHQGNNYLLEIQIFNSFALLAINSKVLLSEF